MAPLLQMSEAANLALHTMAHLASRPGERLSARELAEVFNASENHLAKVLQRLSRAGLLQSTRGPGGGFVLGRPAGDITLLMVFEAVDGPLQFSDCLFQRPVCNGRSCVMGKTLRRANAMFEKHFSQTTLATYAKGAWRKP